MILIDVIAPYFVYTRGPSMLYHFCSTYTEPPLLLQHSEAPPINLKCFLVQKFKMDQYSGLEELSYIVIHKSEDKLL